MCFVDDMGRKKAVAIGVVIILTLLNVWLVRNLMSPGEPRPYSQVRLKPKSGRKMSDILVIAIQDIHPIEHLEEARAMEKKVAQTPVNKLKEDSHLIPYSGQAMTRRDASLLKSNIREIDPDKFNTLKLKLENLKNQLEVNKLGVLRHR